MHYFLNNIKTNYKELIDHYILNDQELFFTYLKSNFEITFNYLKSNFKINFNYDAPYGIGGRIIPNKFEENERYKEKIKTLKIQNFLKNLQSIQFNFSTLKYFDPGTDTFNDYCQTIYLVEKPDWSDFKNFVFCFLRQQWNKEKNTECEKDFKKYCKLIEYLFKKYTPPQNFDPLSAELNSKNFPNNRVEVLATIENYKIFNRFIKKNFHDSQNFIYIKVEPKKDYRDLLTKYQYCIFKYADHFAQINRLCLFDNKLNKLTYLNNHIFISKYDTKNISNKSEELKDYLNKFGINEFIKKELITDIFAFE